MKARILVGVMLMAAVAGAVVHLTSASASIDVLMAKPTSAQEDRGGIEYVDAGPVPAACREPKHVTVLAYTSDSCPGCRKLSKHLDRLVNTRPDVAVRIVDLGRRWSARNCKSLYGIDIYSVPHILLFDADGNLLAEDIGRDKAGLKLLYEWLNAEIRRPRQ